MKTRTIKQTVTFKASPHEVYEALMDSKLHAKFTKAKARISRRVGGKIVAADGWITGINVKLTQDKLIVQKWRGDDWPKGHYSLAKFAFKKAANGTKLVFTQTGVPEDKYDDINDGWRTYYWDHMKKMLE